MAHAEPVLYGLNAALQKCVLCVLLNTERGSPPAFIHGMLFIDALLGAEMIPIPIGLGRERCIISTT